MAKQLSEARFHTGGRSAQSSVVVVTVVIMIVIMLMIMIMIMVIVIMVVLDVNRVGSPLAETR